MKKFKPIFPDFPHILHGGDYNPEQWVETPEIWDEDMRLMKLAHTNEMTMGIFSWSEIEPEEGVFDFSVFDTMMDKIHKNNGKVIFATPSAARPKWLSDKYPEVRRVMENGAREPYRARHNHCPSSPIYRQKVRIINEKLAERYGNHPALLGWHISNEYANSPGIVCYCDKCVEKFRMWLKDKYGTIDKLNHEYWSWFWSHRFNSFDEIEAPAPSGDGTLHGLTLDWKRFFSHNLTDFMKEEIKAIRKYSDRPVTINCMPMCTHIDYDVLSKELDFYSVDVYPKWGDGLYRAAHEQSMMLDRSRGYKHGEPFIVMESSPGPECYNMWFTKAPSLELKRMEALKMIAHGSDSVLYFQWRKGRGGTEKIQSAVVDHFGSENTRTFKNVSEIGQILEKLDGVVGCGVHSDVAIVESTEQRWALNGTPGMSTWENRNECYETLCAYYNAFYDRNIPTDIISYDADFSKYKVLVLPTPYIMSEELGKKVKEYVAKGGVLISTYLTAYANENDLAYLGGMPGAGLSEVFGIRVDDIDNYAPIRRAGLFPMEYKNSVSYQGKEFSVTGIAEYIIPSTAIPVATYTSNFQAGTGAAYENHYGNGCAYYIGFYQDGEFQKAFIGDLIDKLGLSPSMSVKYDEGISLRKRWRKLLFHLQ